MGPHLWLRWSWADLRRRWPQVAAIAAVIAVGTGLYAALGSVSIWRVESNDASFALLRAHDLRVSLSEGDAVGAGDLLAAARGLPLAAARERLVLPAQVDASTAGRAVLTPGRIVGGDAGEAPVDAIHIERGRGLRPADRGRRVAVLEANYAEYHGLPPAGRIRLSGGGSLRYVGQGRHPDWLVVTTPGVSFGAEANLGVVFTSLETAQRLAGRPGAVNELVLRLAPGADPAQAREALAAGLAERLPGTAATITAGADEPAHRLLYLDAENDQRVYDAIALLLLLGAALAAFNLASRVVEAQRREIGIGMALGMPPRLLAIRPLALGAQVALLGAGLGVLAGVAAGAAFRAVLVDLLPLPVTVTDFQPAVFVRGALLGVVVPIAATLYPVWRGVRVPPIEAIRVGARAASGGGLAPLARRLPLPGRTIARMGPRNVVRAPRRALMTAGGLAAVIAALVAISGLIDSFDATIARSESETAQSTPDRLDVALDGFHPAGSAVVRGVAAAGGVAAAEPGVRIAGTLGAGGRQVGALVGLVDPDSPMWTPTVTEGGPVRDPGSIVIAAAAAEDLGVGVGDEVVLVAPRRRGPDAAGVLQARLRVAGIHPNPFRFLAYMSPSAAPAFGVAGLVNAVSVLPAAGRSADDVQRALFGAAGVASVQEATTATRVARERLDQYGGILRIAEVAALVLAALIAVNAAGINADERVREHATMMAFGVPLRSVVGMGVVESALVGAIGTILGVALGRAVLGWIVGSLLSETLPDLGAVVSISGSSLAAAAVVGVVAAALAPLLTARGIARLDVPSALRVVE